LAATTQDRAVVEMHLGLVSLSLDRLKDGRYWLEQSYQSARIVIDALTKQSANVKVLKGKLSTAVLSVYYPAGLVVLPRKLKRVWGAADARTALIEFLPFVNSLAVCVNTLATEPIVPSLELVISPDGEHTIHEK
jgi:hypothetical protein